MRELLKMRNDQNRIPYLINSAGTTMLLFFGVFYSLFSLSKENDFLISEYPIIAFFVAFFAFFFTVKLLVWLNFRVSFGVKRLVTFSLACCYLFLYVVIFFLGADWYVVSLNYYVFGVFLFLFVCADLVDEANGK